MQLNGEAAERLRRDPGLARRVNQAAEHAVLAGPADEEVAELRRNGYRPETAQGSSRSRLAWEQVLVDLLAAEPLTRRQLRVAVMARELVHEHLEVFNDLLREYRLDLARVAGLDRSQPGSARKALMELSDRVPTMRISADLKTELFADRTRAWTVNDVYDTDALSVALPYCDVVVTDKDAAHRARKTGVEDRHAVLLLTSPAELLDVLPALTSKAVSTAGDTTGWDAVGPGVGFCTRDPFGPSKGSPDA